VPFATKRSCFARFFEKVRSLILNMEALFSKIASLQSVHDDMSVKSCENCIMILVTMRIYGFCTLELLVYLMVPDWNSESLKLVPLCFELA
jgi:hypothetical protein